MFYFNNCHGRQHARIFGSGAFYDLATTGFHASLARNLSPGERCVVAGSAKGGQVEFAWFSFVREEVKPNDKNKDCRVFFGDPIKSETCARGDAARDGIYSAFFDKNGNFKRLSVLQGERDAGHRKARKESASRGLKWAWADRPVEASQDHFELRYGSAGGSDSAKWLHVARVGPPRQDTFAVEWLVDRVDPAHREIVEAVVTELDFYLVEKGEADPWAYAAYQCGTSANIYSDVHWSFHEGSDSSSNSSA